MGERDLRRLQVGAWLSPSYSQSAILVNTLILESCRAPSNMCPSREIKETPAHLKVAVGSRPVSSSHFAGV